MSEHCVLTSIMRPGRRLIVIAVSIIVKEFEMDPGGLEGFRQEAGHTTALYKQMQQAPCRHRKATRPLFTQKRRQCSNRQPRALQRQSSGYNYRMGDCDSVQLLFTAWKLHQ